MTKKVQNAILIATGGVGVTVFASIGIFADGNIIAKLAAAMTTMSGFSAMLLGIALLGKEALKLIKKEFGNG